MPTAKDEFADFSAGPDSSAHHAVAVTPSDTDELEVVSRALWIGNAGDIKVTLISGDVATFPNAIGWMPVRVRQVYAAGTTATGIVAVW